MGLVGTMLSRIWAIGWIAASLPLMSAAPMMLKPAPGWKMLAKMRPMRTATAEVSR